MGRLVFFLLTLAVTGYVTYVYLTGRTSPSGQAAVSADGPSGPKQQLDHVRSTAKSIEQDAQRRVDEMLKQGEKTE